MAKKKLEQRHIYNLKRDQVDERDYKLSKLEVEEIPDKVDLREECPPIFEQKEGSCTAQAGVAAYMMLRDTEEMYSRLYLYYKERLLEGNTEIDSGATMRSIGRALQKFGVPKERTWPYISDRFNVAPTAIADKEASFNKISKYTRLKNINEIKRYIATYKQPVLIGMQVYDSFEKVGKNGIVPMPNQAKEELLGGHCVLVVGYDNNFRKKPSFWECLLNTLFGLSVDTGDTGYFICRNSWSERWGDNGYFYISYSFVRTHCFDFWTIQ